MSWIRILLFLFLMMAAGRQVLGFGQNESSEVINTDPLTVESVEIPAYTIGERTEMVIHFELPRDHHAYLDQFHVEVESPQYIYVSEPQITPVVDFKDPVTGKVKKGTTGVGQIKTLFQISKETAEKQPNLRKLNELPLQLILTYQACTKTYCLFPTKKPVQAKVILNSGPNTPSSSATESSNLSLRERFEESLNQNWALTFFIVFLAGFLTSLTPCIFPMIPITLAVLGGQGLNQKEKASKWQGFQLSISYVFGIAVTYSILGVLAALSGALFGSLLGHPVVVAVIALIFVAMAFSLFGFYEVKLPDQLTNSMAKKIPVGSSHTLSLIKAFIAGLFAGVMASPCVGPVLVSILTYVAQTQNVTFGFLLLFTFAIGLGQIFILLGTFSHLTQKLPRSGPWMVRVKNAFGVLLLILAAYFVWPVLPQLKFTSNSQLEPALKPNWLPYSEENLEKARLSGLPVILDIKADWCVACKELEFKTFAHKEVHDLGKRFVWLEFDATQDSPELEQLKKKYSIVGLPFVTFHDPSGQWRQELTVTGFEGPAPFIKRMQKALSESKSP